MPRAAGSNAGCSPRPGVASFTPPQLDWMGSSSRGQHSWDNVAATVHARDAVAGAPVQDKLTAHKHFAYLPLFCGCSSAARSSLEAEASRLRASGVGTSLSFVLCGDLLPLLPMAAGAARGGLAKAGN